ncbi:MAG: hypothetical protein CMB99_03505 [Flavobacteriaceae bacterium]|nr:hypothetical protein [Flavobacteriaceae bacterium]|tara:strand:+ start:154514 stop:155377 length:864 start_codon:yes stop_codon:yes gene_type:complete
MKRILLIIGLLFITYHLTGQDLMNKSEFTKYVLKETSKTNQKVRLLVFDKLILGSKFNNLSFLHSLKDEYPAYKSKPEQLPSIVARFIARFGSIYALNPTYKIDTTQIVPLLKPKEFLNKTLTFDEEKVVSKEFNKDLVIIYVENQEKGYNGYRFFSTKELERIGLNEDNMHALALKNLQGLLPDLSEYTLDRPVYRMYRAVGKSKGSKYLSSLLLLPEFLANEKNRLNQDLVIGIPKENQLIIAGKKNKQGIREMKMYARMNYYLKKDQLLTKKLYRYNGEQLKKY